MEGFSMPNFSSVLVITIRNPRNFSDSFYYTFILKLHEGILGLHEANNREKVVLQEKHDFTLLIKFPFC